MSGIRTRTNANAFCVAIAFLCLGSNMTAATNLVTAVYGKKVLETQLNVAAKQTSVTRWGVQFDLAQNRTQLGIARIGVFRSIDEARRLLDDLVMNTSVGPTRKFAVPIGEKTYGWNRRICFVRDNVLVDLTLTKSSVEGAARKIDQALSQAGEGVTRGARIGVSRVEDVELAADGSGWIAQTKPKLSGFTAILDRSGMETCSDQFADQVCFFDEGCVIAEPMKCDKSFLLAKREAAKAKAGKDKTPSAETRRKQEKEATATLRDKASSAYNRHKAVIALGNSGDMSTIPILLAELERTRDPVVKQNTIAALGRLRAKQAVPNLLKLLEAPVTGNVSDEGEWEAIYRRNAASALGSIGDSLAVPTLKKIVDATHEYQSVRDAARSALRKIEKPEGQ